MKITRLKKRFISVFIITAILLGCLPLSIFASDDIPDIEVPLEPEIKITEVLDRREESIKHFKMPDGTYNAISYAGAVHRMNPDGEWIDINNDLSITTIGSKQLYTTNDSRITFAKAYSSNEDIMTLRENGYVISMALLSEENDGDMSMDMNDTASLVTVNNSDYIRPDSFDTIEDAIEINNKSSISYSNVLADTDIEYIMNGNDIKENIIVKDRSDSYVYAFSLSLDGLIPVLDESGTIYLNDSENEETIYVIPAPYMYDSNDEYSEEVYYELFHVEGDKYLLTVTADESWINDEERAFPVTVDPTIFSDEASKDTYIAANDPNFAYGRHPQLWVNSNDTALLYIPLPNIHTDSSASVFGFADLHINYYSMAVYGDTTVGVHKITGNWVENTATYNNTNQYIDSTRIRSKKLTTVQGRDSEDPHLGVIEINEAVKGYYNAGKPFYGVAIKKVSGGHIIINSREVSSSDESYINVGYEILDIESGKDYYIQNKDTNSFLQISENDAPNYDTENAGMDLQNLSAGSGTHQMWKFVYLNSGYFKIQSVESGKVLAVETTNGSPYGIDIVQQTYSGLTQQQWRIARSSHGGYIFVPRSSEAYDDFLCMVGLSDRSGSYIFQLDYVNDSTYYDEWILAKIGYVSEKAVLETQDEEVWCWVAVSKMFAMHYNPSNNPIPYTQEQVVNYVYENPKDPEKLPGGVARAQEAIQYYLEGANENYSCTTEGKEYRIYTQDVLLQFLDDEQVLILGTTIYYSDYLEELPSTHFIFVYGYVVIDSEIYFMIRDPYFPTNNGDWEGKSYLLSYLELVSRDHRGYHKKYGEVNCNTRWTDFVVMVNEKTSEYKDNYVPHNLFD